MRDWPLQGLLQCWWFSVFFVVCLLLGASVEFFARVLCHASVAWAVVCNLCLEGSAYPSHPCGVILPAAAAGTALKILELLSCNSTASSLHQMLATCSMRGVWGGTNVPAGGSTALAPLLRLGWGQHRAAAFVPPDAAAFWFCPCCFCVGHPTHISRSRSYRPTRAELRFHVFRQTVVVCVVWETLHCSACLRFEYVGEEVGHLPSLGLCARLCTRCVVAVLSHIVGAPGQAYGLAVTHMAVNRVCILAPVQFNPEFIALCK